MPLQQTHAPLKLDATQRGELMRRAYAAWLKAGNVELPNERSGVKMRLGLAYVVLHGVVGVLMVYRVRPDNLALRALKRWPESLES